MITAPWPPPLWKASVLRPPGPPRGADLRARVPRGDGRVHGPPQGGARSREPTGRAGVAKFGDHCILVEGGLTALPEVFSGARESQDGV